jgi:hypothetical protein
MFESRRTSIVISHVSTYRSSSVSSTVTRTLAWASPMTRHQVNWRDGIMPDDPDSEMQDSGGLELAPSTPIHIIGAWDSDGIVVGERV